MNILSCGKNEGEVFIIFFFVFRKKEKYIETQEMTRIFPDYKFHFLFSFSLLFYLSC